LNAGCSLADTITEDQLIRWKREYPDAVVISYVNTSAAIKALSDYCCTSSNAVKVVEAIDPDRDILFLPDFFLGSHVVRMTGRKNIHVWNGECHVHAAIENENMINKVRRHPDSELLIHPECGCTTRALAIPPREATSRILSTDGMLSYARTSPSGTFIVATEVGLLYRLRKENPEKTFIAAHDDALCPFMNMISLEKIRDSLRDGQYQVNVPAAVGKKALIPLERMVAVG
ncbi:MAG: quinolinate synthase NadA, partial [Firmicutes bacterium]|nr:quinolinate synthase NadA [Bacillota bacterium]